MSSSGTAMHETLLITIIDFIKVTKEYHNNKYIEKVIKTLDEQTDVVPLFEMT